MPSAAAQRTWRDEARILGACLLAVMPFWLPTVAHWVEGGALGTGFIQYDQPGYLANARAIITRGSGILFPNPFDPSPASPAIYLNLLAVLTAGLRLLLPAVGEGVLYNIMGAVFGIAGARVTYTLIRHCLGTEGRYLSCLLILTYWTGGLMGLPALAENLAVGVPWDTEVMRFDPFEGWGLQNWGRNAIIATEAFYHLLVAGMLLSVLRRRWWVLIVLALTIACTHAFTGTQILLILLAYCGFSTVRDGRERVPLWVTGALGGIAAGFFAYYLAYLPSVDSHRHLHDRWTLAWNLPPVVSLMAYGPVAVLAVLALRGRMHRIKPVVPLFLATALVSLGLVHHDLFMKAHQPLHFTRGYLWFGLWMLGLPLVGRWVAAALETPKFKRLAVAALVAAVAWSDNALFLWHSRQSARQAGLYFQPGESELLAGLDAAGRQDVVFAPDLRLAYLLAVYTDMRPWISNRWYTPDFDARVGEATAFMEGRADLAGVASVLIGNDRIPDWLAASTAWAKAVESPQYTLFTRL